MSPPPSDGQRPPLPWVERNRLGFVNALVETIKLVVTDPQEAFARIRSDGDYMSPFLFGLLIAWTMAIVSQLWSFVFNSVFSFGDQTMVGLGFVNILIIMVLYPLIYVIMIFIWAGLHQLGLMVLSALDQSRAGFEGTFKVLSYAMVAQLANIIPLIGPLISFVAVIVFLVYGFQSVHHTSQGKAIGAALLPIAICCLCVIVIVIVFGGAIAAAMAGAGGAAAFQ